MSAPVSPTVSHPAEAEEVRSHSLLRPAILLLLRDQESPGYELWGRLAELGLELPPTINGLYRSLRTMVDEGLVSSYWSTPDRGPARRVYSITELGEEHLEQSMAALARLLRTMRATGLDQVALAALRAMLNRYRSGS